MEKFSKIMIEIKYILLYYIVISLLLFSLMGIDKLKAVFHKWRISENTLLCLGALGGFIGGFAGMAVFHHKIRKPVFWTVYIFTAFLHIGVSAFLVYKEVYLC